MNHFRFGSVERAQGDVGSLVAGRWRTQVGPRLLATTCIWLTSTTWSCSQRASGPPVSETVWSCDELERAPERASAVPSIAAAAVWIAKEPLAEPVVFNFAEARANGTLGRQVMADGQAWFIFSLPLTRLAVGLDDVSSYRIEGKFITCGHLDSSTVAPRPFTALPLAPTVPRAEGLHLIARYPPAESSVEACASGEHTALDWPPRSSDLALVGSLLAVARGPDGLRVLDISQTSEGTIREVGHLPAAVGDDYNDVESIDDVTVAVASQKYGLVIVDLSQPHLPSVLSHSWPLQAPRDGHNLWVVEDRLFLAQAPPVGTGALAAFDVADVRSPRLLWRTQLAGGHDAHDVFVAGRTAYVSSLRGGLYLVDTHTGQWQRRYPLPFAHSVGRLEDRGPDERYLLTQETPDSHLQLLTIDASSKELRSRPLPQSWIDHSLPTQRPVKFLSAAAPHKLTCRGDTCFVAHHQLGLRIIDVGPSDAVFDAPTLKAYFHTWSPHPESERNWLQGATAVAVDLPWIYVLDTCAGVLALEQLQ